MDNEECINKYAVVTFHSSEGPEDSLLSSHQRQQAPTRENIERSRVANSDNRKSWLDKDDNGNNDKTIYCLADSVWVLQRSVGPSSVIRARGGKLSLRSLENSYCCVRSMCTVDEKTNKATTQCKINTPSGWWFNWTRLLPFSLKLLVNGVFKFSQKEKKNFFFLPCFHF